MLLYLLNSLVCHVLYWSWYNLHLRFVLQSYWFCYYLVLRLLNITHLLLMALGWFYMLLLFSRVVKLVIGYWILSAHCKNGGSWKLAFIKNILFPCWWRDSLLNVWLRLLELLLNIQTSLTYRLSGKKNRLSSNLWCLNSMHLCWLKIIGIKLNILLWYLSIIQLIGNMSTNIELWLDWLLHIITHQTSVIKDVS